jgi:signal peptidase I
MKMRRIAGILGAFIVLAAAVLTAAIVYHPDIRLATGSSMEPTVSGPAVVHCTGDGNITGEDIDVGDIVVIDVSDRDARYPDMSDDGDRTVMHRVTFIDRDVSPVNLKTQGDNETASDGYSDVENIECIHQGHVSLPL